MSSICKKMSVECDINKYCLTFSIYVTSSEKSCLIQSLFMKPYEIIRYDVCGENKFKFWPHHIYGKIIVFVILQCVM